MWAACPVLKTWPSTTAGKPDWLASASTTRDPWTICGAVQVPSLSPTAREFRAAPGVTTAPPVVLPSALLMAIPTTTPQSSAPTAKDRQYRATAEVRSLPV